MECARLSSLLVIALIQLSQTEITSTLPESWYAANVISDGVYSPRPLSELFSTEATFSSTNPIVVLPSSTTTPSSVVSTSNLPNVAFSTSTISTTYGTTTESPATEVSVLPLSTERPVQPLPAVTVVTQPPPTPTVFISTTEATPPPPTPVVFVSTTEATQPPQPQQPQLPTLSQFQQPPAPPSPPPFPSTPQQIEIQTAQQSSPLPPQQVPNVPPNYFLLYQQVQQPAQNSPPFSSPPASTTQQVQQPAQNSPPSSPPVITTTTTLPPSTSTPLSSLSTQAPCATGTPVSVPANSQFPTYRIRMVAPSGSVTKVRINANPTAPTTTRRPSTTRTRRRNRNNFDGCVNGCGGTRQPICASPSGVSPIDPDTLKGFPSVCHMACHNSFRKTIYEKVADGKCGRLRTRIRPINANKLTKNDLNKATYTIVQSGPPTVLEFSPLNS